MSIADAISATVGASGSAAFSTRDPGFPAASRISSAARAGARTEASVDARGSGRANAREAVSDWVEEGGFRYRKSGGRDITVTVRVKVPSVVPGLNDWWAERSTTMPNERSRIGF